ncbi:chitin disaccharide deacetylase [Brevibacillus fluminis]|uniref:chitin disaccharide deacetylase n=1 Tax=Brevibacillus fluminis TaxID=511487 RepID=UPI003F8B951B
MKLIVNADDFGYSKGVNLGIVEAHAEGIVTSATMMVNMYAFDHAVRLAAAHPALGIGIHLVLTCGYPVTDQAKTLVDADGRFRRGQEHLDAADPLEVEREFTAQIERFLASGLVPTHLDSHHHVHAHPGILPVVLRLAERYRLPIRNPWTAAPQMRPADRRITTTEAFSHRFYGDGLTEATLLAIVEKLADSATAEIMCHPAYLDAELLAGSSYALPRTRELQILTSAAVTSFIAKRQIPLCTFNDIG